MAEHQGLLPSEQPLQLLDESGVPVVGTDLRMPDSQRLLEAYTSLVIGRRVNDQASALVRQGRLAVYPSSHGQEACQTGAALALADGDWLFPTYRDTAAVIARGVDPVEVLTLLKGDWHAGYDPYAHNVASQATPLATQLLHAVGVAHAARLRGEDTVVMALCGDGATSEGDFHEALNFAAVFKAPVVFFVQNNEYAISVPLAKQSAAPSLAHKGVGYGVNGERVDGNDAAAVLAVLERAVEAARSGEGPQLVEGHTYRMQAHTNADDASRYRSEEEVDPWVARDPLLRMETYLKKKRVLTKARQAEIAEQAEKVAAHMREGVNKDIEPNGAELFAHVFAEPTPQLTEQAAFLADELSREGN
ncbi:pyruvate dehydrogenase (acetyl-transferring) E1 component subunit alpha [Nocardiopsis metallicus]|uniref:Pyruvate dehydrogenase E1 component alpha subunit n=1 Tax=Nocardiopsis metallicus TaxID=179819 RepID=A0A840WQN7_9ACTN|nr:pyruvate dehydrogenase (acetyl-transferring) E1 component subunit alpha [Nocardiopsis metallicus]MBB5493907.1 pyruvate dehydrogenase E1 component alpha subunit [Nocardiopsis metallicus]